jgi:hypothetical protein
LIEQDNFYNAVQFFGFFSDRKITEILEQVFDKLKLSSSYCGMQQGRSIRCPRVIIRHLADQKLGNLEVAKKRRVVMAREAIRILLFQLMSWAVVVDHSDNVQTERISRDTYFPVLQASIRGLSL